jgi:hypothetical protein
MSYLIGNITNNENIWSSSYLIIFKTLIERLFSLWGFGFIVKSYFFQHLLPNVKLLFK